MSHKSIANIKRGQAILTSLAIAETLSQEMISLANLLAIEAGLDFYWALRLIENICKEILPSHQGIAKLKIFRTVIRERLKEEFIGYEESRDHSETTSDARHAGCP